MKGIPTRRAEQHAVPWWFGGLLLSLCLAGEVSPAVAQAGPDRTDLIRLLTTLQGICPDTVIVLDAIPGGPVHRYPVPESLADSAGHDYESLDRKAMGRRLNVALQLMIADGPDKAVEMMCGLIANRSQVHGLGDELPLKVVNDMGIVLRKVGRSIDSRALLQDTLVVVDALRPFNLGAELSVQQNLATALVSLGYYQAAERLYRDALDRAVAARAPLLVSGPIMSNLGAVLAMQSRLTDGEKLLREELALRQEIPYNDQRITFSLDNLGVNLTAQHRFKEAEPLLRQGLEIRQRLSPELRVNTAFSQIHLAANLLAQGRLEEAHRLASAALEIRQREMPANHTDTIEATNLLAQIELKRGHATAALALARTALQAALTTAAREGIAISDEARTTGYGNSGDAASVLTSAAWQMSARQQHRWRAAAIPAVAEEVFAAMQELTWSSTAAALARMSARSAAREAGLADVAADYEQQLLRRVALNQQFVEQAMPGGPEVGERLATLRQQELAAEAQIERATRALEQRFPAFFQYILPTPVSLAGLQRSLLHDDEVLVLMTPGHGEERGYLWAVTGTAAAWAQLPVSRIQLEAQIRNLRSSLDPQGVRSADSGSPSSYPPEARGFRRAIAYGLYSSLFGSTDIEALLRTHRRWLLVPQGALIALPFAALVTRFPSGGPAADLDPHTLRTTHWLGLEHVISVLPSVRSLEVLRRKYPTSNRASRRFFGLGDPEFAADAQQLLKPVAQYFRDSAADIEAIRMLPRLPGTRAEITQMAAIYHEGAEDYLLGADATEHAIWHRPQGRGLSEYQILDFATHGLVAGELSSTLSEPALALTPPLRPVSPAGPTGDPDPGASSEINEDGLLTASEIATLKLNADWVILSACNTAAGNRLDAEGLTGLARAFLLAGARALLVSHWRVRDDAASRLTTRTLQLMEADSTLTRGEALQASMRQLMMDPSLDHTVRSWAQPSAWAVFALVGVD